MDDEDKRSERIVHPLGGVQQTTFINESGLYSLILSSKLPKAREFKRWVTAEVLPQIRRTGGYIVHLPFTDLQCTIRPNYSLAKGNAADFRTAPPITTPKRHAYGRWFQLVSVSVLFLAGCLAKGPCFLFCRSRISQILSIFAARGFETQTIL